MKTKLNKNIFLGMLLLTMLTVLASAQTLTWDDSKYNVSSTYVWFKDGTTEVGYIQFSSSGALWFVQSSNNRVLTPTYTLGQWYEIELKNINFSTYTFDVWLDGVEKFTDLTFTNNVPEIDNMRVATLYTTTLSYIDYIYGYSQLQENNPEIYEIGIFV